MSDMRTPDRLEEAAHWFAARRRGVMSVEERARYDAWTRDVRNISAMLQLERTWSILGAGEDTPLGTEEAPALPVRSRSLVRQALLAAMCAVSLAIGVLSYSDDSGFWTTLNWTDR